MSDLKFYQDPISQPCRAVLSLLHMGKLKYENIYINLFKGDQKKPQYLAINPFGTVPCLVHNNINLCESNAILFYLCEAFPNELGKYIGTTIQERALVQQYLSWYQGSYRPGVIRPLRFKLAAVRANSPVFKAELTQLEKKCEQTLDLLNQILGKGNQFVAGNNLTIADLLIFAETTNCETYKLDLAPWKNVKEWYERVLAIEAVTQIHGKWREGLPIAHAMFEKVTFKE